MTGTDIHVKMKMAATEITTNKYLGKLFLMLKSLNFKLINGMFDTIRYESSNVNPYKNTGQNF